MVKHFTIFKKLNVWSSRLFRGFSYFKKGFYHIYERIKSSFSQFCLAFEFIWNYNNNNFSSLQIVQNKRRRRLGFKKMVESQDSLYNMDS